MVSFQCDACADVVKKPKLDSHRSRCHSSFTCIDCSTTFAGPKQYNAHTSCISEAQKYEKSLYKGKNTRPINTRGSNTFYRPGQSRATGPNDQPLGEKAKMVYTPPNELEESKPSTSTQHSNSAPASAPAPLTSNSHTPATAVNAPATLNTDAAPVQADTTAPNASSKKDKKRKKRESPPPGETRAERKKRKKEERAVRKKEKLRKKAEEKAAKAAEMKARKQAKQALKFGGAAKMATRAAEETGTTEPPVELADPAVDVIMDESAVLALDGQVAQPQPQQTQLSESRVEKDDTDGKSKEKKKKKKDKSKPEQAQPNGESTTADPLQEGENQEVKKKKKDKKKKENGVLEASNAMEVDATLESAPASTSGTKSKKRKREDDDVGGKDDVEEETRVSLEKLSFKEKAKAEKKARKAAKAAKKAQEGTEAA